MPQVIKSYSFNQEEIIDNILTLYAKSKRIEVDTTYSIGNFYKNGRILQPHFKFDINPKAPDIIRGRASSLPFEDNSINTLVFDPPFLVNINGDQSNLKMVKRFSCYKSINDLKNDYYQSLTEFHRVLKVGGILIFKCQDLTYAGTNHMISDWIVNNAGNMGLKPVDKFILLSDKRIISRGNQRHARKYHSYFLVFQKINIKEPISKIIPIRGIQPTINYRSQIMKEAWILARKEAFLKGGSCRDYISIGLKIAWRNYKTRDQVQLRIAA